MMFLKRILARWVNEGAEDHCKYPGPPTAVRTGRGNVRSSGRKTNPFEDEWGGTDEFKNPMNITLYNANGGRIIKFSRWDQHADETVETTYIVSSDENFEEALGKFIALEAMKYVD